MMRKLIIVAMLAASAIAGQAQAGNAPYSLSKTPIGVLLADPAAKSVLARHFPEFIANRSVEQGKANRFTVRFIKRFKPRIFTDAHMAAAEAELQKLPAR